ncbi:hypothetical protein WJX77_004455 [Trebouxia sp. C0004]
MQSISSSSQHTCLLQKRTAFARRRTVSLPRCSCLAAQANTGWKPKVSTPQSMAATTCALALSCLCAGGAYAAEPAEVFQRSGCVGCHAGGGNIVQAGASLQTSDLQKNGAATTDAIYKLVYYGKGKMPGYGKECMPRGKCTFGPRLSDEDVQRLSQYVLDQAAVKWK